MKFTANWQMVIGFALLVITNASAQGLIPDTDTGRWVILVSSSLGLFMQRIGLQTYPETPPRQSPPKS